ncbi:MAG TPA: hypothetical protein VJ110_01540 [Candidatus Nanoarchaeia archaeon]|nr:hypothetical protein [Candidatus Nanoarchaeia archaeon]
MAGQKVVTELAYKPELKNTKIIMDGPSPNIAKTAIRCGLHEDLANRVDQLQIQIHEDESGELYFFSNGKQVGFGYVPPKLIVSVPQNYEEVQNG